MRLLSPGGGVVSSAAGVAALPRVRNGLIDQFAFTLRVGLWWAAKQIGEVLPPQPPCGSGRNHARSETTLDGDADLFPMFDATYELSEFLAGLSRTNRGHAE